MACEELGACCGCCDEVTCGDCVWCRKHGCALPQMAPCTGECCFCASKCFLVPIIGAVVNDNRNCYDLCYNPNTGGPCDPAATCCYPCDPSSGPVVDPDCIRRVSSCQGAGCFPPQRFGQCQSNSACEQMNGTVFITMDPYGYGYGDCECFSGGWQMATPKCEVGTIDPCCLEGIAYACACVTDPACCKNFPSESCPSYSPPVYCPVPRCVQLSGCPFFGGSYQDCVDAGGPFAQTCDDGFSACGNKVPGDESDCTGKWCLYVNSCIYREDDYTNWPIVTDILVWTVTVSCPGFSGNFEKRFYEGIDFTEAFGGIYCDTAQVLTRVGSINPQSLCDWNAGTVGLIPIACPPTFWLTPQSLYHIKDDEKYINLSEIKRRKLMKKFETNTIGYVNKIWHKLGLDEIDPNSNLFREQTETNILRALENADAEELDQFSEDSFTDVGPFSKKIYDSILEDTFKKQIKRVEKIRKSEEILAIYEDKCSHCPYKSSEDICLLANKKVGPKLAFGNMLTDAEAECPDFPPRWGKSENLETIEKPVSIADFLRRQAIPPPKIL